MDSDKESSQAILENDSQESFDDNIKLPPELESSILEILQTNDPIDSRDFNLIEYLNQMLPNEHALASIDVTAKRLQAKMRQLEADIRELTRMQTDCGQRGSEEVAEAKKAIEDLFNQIRQIKEKASQSEVMVQEITQDIKSLDYAKKHLTTSITALKRLQMLVLVARNFVHSGTPFPSFSTDGSLTVQAAPLSDACLVIDIMGADVKKQLIDWYCDRQLGEYKRIFRGFEGRHDSSWLFFLNKSSDLESTSRRYSWLKRVLKSHDEEHALIFPVDWRVSEALCIEFCEITREAISKTLSKAESELDVKTLLKNLQLTIEFEGQLAKRFSQDVPKLSGVESTVLRIDFTKSISISFEPYLGLYIDAEDKTLSEMVNSYRTESVPDDESSTSVLQSSTDLFYYYREALSNCAKLSTKKPFFGLCNVFAKWLRVYANEVLTGRLPNNLSKCKPISEVGAEQTSLLEMPTMGIENSAPPPTTFTKIVNKGINKVEVILKTVLTPLDPHEGLVDNYILLIADKNLGNFQKIMELKGLKKAEQQQIIEVFQQIVSKNPDLPENSNIMSSITLPPFITPSLPSSFPALFSTPVGGSLNNVVPERFVSGISSSAIVDQSGAVKKFSEIRKVLNWRKKDANDGSGGGNLMKKDGDQ
ncbi:11268_t:CDS:10 [Acaulospora colombiana]|uniref:11268_t:CDS:1 n=1 Tax=Acaulospora colombiana TaxID=27376 RepID=A0ACA9JW38_9GLOM|nr:11268_t:CDS:10 [Acaulospora colombiana]